MKKLQNLLFSIFFIFAFNNAFCQGIPADDLFRAYVQDTANNCASIALIKANLNAFGLTNIYKLKILPKNQKEYILKDNSVVILKDAEINLAKKQMRIDVTNANTPYLKSIVDTSIVCYAIMAKRFPIEFPKLAKKTFEKNLAYISDTSFDVRYGINLLGTGDYVIFLRRWSSIIGLTGVVVWSPGHTVFASDYRCDMKGNTSNFSRGSRSYLRFWGRMYIDPSQSIPSP